MPSTLLVSGLSTVATVGQSPLVDTLVRGTVLLLLLFAMAPVLRRASAGLRHLVWSAGLVGVLLLPLLATSMPRARVLPWTEAASVSAVPLAPAPGAPAAVAAAALPDVSAGPTPATGPCEGCGTGAPAAVAPMRGGGGGGGGASWSIMAWVLVIWGAGAALLLARLAAGALAVRRIGRQATPLQDAGWTTPLYEASDRLELRNAPRLLMSDAVQLPFTAGLLRPTIVLPLSAADWSEERRRAVLAHELAHIRRRDLFSHFVGRVACALYWFHPLVWVAARRARAEGERACDDVVLATGARASAYADHLLQIVFAASRTSAPVLAIPMAQRREFEGRMLAILEPGSRRPGPGRTQAVGVLAALTAMVLLVAAAAPGAPASPLEAGNVGPTTRVGAAVERASAVPALPVAPAAPSLFRTPGPLALAPTQDTGEARRHKSRDSSWLGGVVADALEGADIGHVTSQAVAGALAGLDIGHITTQAVTGALAGSTGGMPTPMPTPTPAPAPMVFGGHRVYEPRLAQTPQVHRRRQSSADPRTVAALIEALKDESAGVRARAAYSLGQLGDPKAVPALGGVLASDKDAEARRVAAWSLSQLDDPQGAPALGAALRSDASVEVRRTAAWALGELDCAGQLAAVGAAVRGDADAEVRSTAAWTLGQCNDPAAAPALGEALRDGSSDVRQNAAWALGQIAPEKAPAQLVAALRDADAQVRHTAAWALGQIGDPATTPALAAAMKDPVPGVRQVALWALAQAGGPGARDALLEALKSSDPDVRRYAAQALAEIR